MPVKCRNRGEVLHDLRMPCFMKAHDFSHWDEIKPFEQTQTNFKLFSLDSCNISNLSI